MSPLFFISGSRYLSLFFSLTKIRWPIAYVLFFFCLSLSLHSKSVGIKIKLSLILNTTRIQRQFLLSVFVFIDSSCLCFKRRGWLCDFPPKVTLSCIWISIPVNWVILHWYASGADGRAYGHVITKISRIDRLPRVRSPVAPYQVCGYASALRARVALLYYSSSWGCSLTALIRTK